MRAVTFANEPREHTSSRAPAAQRDGGSRVVRGTVPALIVEDDPVFSAALAEVVTRAGFEVATVDTIAAARKAIEARPPNLVLTDLELPDGSGVSLLEDLEDRADIDVVLLSGHATVESAIEALRRGALEYLVKPVDHERLAALLSTVHRSRSASSDAGEGPTARGDFGRMIGASNAMRRVYELIRRVAPTEVTVCILGESGTGKELVAETIHQLSRRRYGPFVPINCGAMPASLIESELFGHERGSFTGATQRRKGHFERASGGTLFLDEVTEMPIELQVRLLRVLETRTVTRIGGDGAVPIDIRVIAAANRSLEGAVRQGKLREDLYYRLSVFPINLPALRDRGEDPVLLAEAFLDELNRGMGLTKTFNDSALEHVRRHPWKGNVRELKNEVHRAYILSGNEVELGRATTPGSAEAGRSQAALESIPLGSSVASVEKKLILATIEHCKGDKARAAGILGISLKTLYNRLNEYAAKPAE
jgi:DNA-binding NtrC family response regulator